MSDEDINFLISIQDLEQPEFDNACLKRENERLKTQLQQKENIIKEVREKVNRYPEFNYSNDYMIFRNEIKEILDKEVN